MIITWKDKVTNEDIRKQTEVAGTCIENGGLQNAPSGNTVGTEGLQEKAVTVEEKLDGHHQTRSERHDHCLERSRRTGDRQSTMASTFRFNIFTFQIHPSRHIMN